MRAVALAERVVKEAGQDVALLDRRAEALEEAVLRPVMDDRSRRPEIRSCVGTVMARASATMRSAVS